MKNTGIEYEKLTQFIFTQIVNQDKALNIDVQHDITFQGKTTSHQIDVYWEFELGGIKYRAIIQAKNWQNKVKQSDMLTFVGVLNDLPSGTKGIYVSLSGYQSGAINVAKAHGISLYELRPPKSEDWKGYIKVLNLTVTCSTPIFNNISIVLDKEWADTVGALLPNEGTKVFTEKDDLFYDEDGHPSQSLFELVQELSNRFPDSVQHIDHKFTNDTFLIFNGQYIKVYGISGEFGHSKATMESKIDAEDFVGCVLKDVISGKTEMFDKNNRLKKSADTGTLADGRSGKTYDRQ